MSFIHPTANVHHSAQVGEGTYVGPHCFVGPQVVIGPSNRLEAYVCVGVEHRDLRRAAPGPVVIGAGNVLREFVTINGGTSAPTRIEDGCTLLRGAHVGANVLIRSQATLSCNVLVGSAAIIGYGANVSLDAIVHQNCAVGAFAAVGLRTVVARHLLPFFTYLGDFARLGRLNRTGLLRAGVSPDDISLFETWAREASLGEGLSPVHHAFATHIAQFAADRDALSASGEVPTSAFVTRAA